MEFHADERPVCIFGDMDTAAILHEKRDPILEVASRHGARNVRVFGSASRGDDHADSDIDLLIDLDRDRSILDLAELVADLRDLLGRPVDVAIDENLHHLLRPQILREARPL